MARNSDQPRAAAGESRLGRTMGGATVGGSGHWSLSDTPAFFWDVLVALLKK